MEKRKITKKIFIIFLIAILTMLLWQIPSKAMRDDMGGGVWQEDPISNPDNFKPSNPDSEDIKTVTDKANVIIGTITTIGVIICAVTLMILGIKYMAGSVEEKAEYKKSMVPYLIGVALLFSVTVFVSVIANIVTGLSNGI